MTLPVRTVAPARPGPAITCDAAPTGRRRAARQRGSLSVWIPFAVMFGIQFIGIVVDGVAVIRAQRSAQSVAAEAARTGGQQLYGPAAMRGLPTELDPAAAAAAARQYIALREMSGTVRVEGDVVIAEVTDTQELAILSVLGLAPVEVTGRAESRSTRAVNGVEVAGGGGR